MPQSYKFKDHSVSQWKKEQALKLRIEDNLTYEEIAKQMGISKAYVALLLKDTVKKSNFHRWAYDSTPYPILTQWMNEHQMSKMDLALKLGYAPSSNSQYIVYKRIKEGRLIKAEIDKLLEITGLPYDVLFRRTDNG